MQTNINVQALTVEAILKAIPIYLHQSGSHTRQSYPNEISSLDDISFRLARRVNCNRARATEGRTPGQRACRVCGKPRTTS